MNDSLLDRTRHPLTDPTYQAQCRATLDVDGALVLPGLVPESVIAAIVDDVADREAEAFFADSTHNVYLTEPDPELPADHAFNRHVRSTKGLIADDQIGADSPLRSIYRDADLRSFLCTVLGIDSIHPYADTLSSINVHYAPDGRELGWHFDNSSFAVTLLLQAPEAGGVFEYVPGARDSAAGEPGFGIVDAVLDGEGAADSATLAFDPGDLVVFRGRDALHRVTPTRGTVTRLLVVFAFNDEPGVRLSASARATFYGRSA
ncbi:MAG: 2OG-Fe(II) oxygenase [Actinomycetota bacterium]